MTVDDVKRCINAGGVVWCENVIQRGDAIQFLVDIGYEIHPSAKDWLKRNPDSPEFLHPGLDSSSVAKINCWRRAELCREFGSPLGKVHGQEVYAFPTAAQLRDKSLAAASLGYREPYVKELATYSDDVWGELQSQSDAKAKATLISMKGIGEKVANCIMLFGLHRMNSYPRDVWMNRLIDDVYHGEFNTSKYDGFAGYVQQLQFYHYRQMAR